MKKLFASLLLLAMLTGLAYAQEQPDEPDQQQLDPKAQERINNLRIAYLTDKLGLTTEQAEKFWPIYREFSQERIKARAELREARRTLKTNPDAKKQQELVDLALKVKQKELDLEKDYSGRLMKVITAEQVLNLRKAEIEFRDMLINQVQQRRQNQQRRENFRDRNQQLKQRN